MKAKIQLLISKIKQQNPITVVVAVSLCLVLLFGIILGTVLVVKSANAYVSLNGITFERGVCSYFASSYKTEYIASLQRQGIDARDTADFWSRKTVVDGKEYTYGELLESNTAAYIKGIIVGNYLFDRYGKLTDDDKAKINEVIDDTLEYKASSSKRRFNELSREYGFDYSDFVDAVTYKYKAEQAKRLIYGESGSSMSASDYKDVRDEYYNEHYSRVLLVFIRTADTFVTDDRGNFVITTDVYGNNVYEMRELSESEIEDRNSTINELRDYIDAKKNGIQTDTSITSDYLSAMGTRYSAENNSNFVLTGYYFADNSAYTRSFPLDSVADMVMDLKIGEYSYTEYDDDSDGANDGICFALRLPLEEEGYSKTTNKEFFTDFYSNLSVTHYAQMLEDLSGSVVIKDKFYQLDFASLPYNSVFGIRF